MQLPTPLVVALLISLSTVTALPEPQLLGGLLGNILNQIPLLYANPPSAIKTNNPSPECANVNNGALLCCQSTLQGVMPLVVKLAQLAGNFRLNPNSINGIYCKKRFETCNPGTKLCCEVDALVSPPPVGDVLSLALYCQNAPTQDSQCSQSGSDGGQ